MTATHDAINRRHRWAPPLHPRYERTEDKDPLNEREIRWAEELHEAGGRLTTTDLHRLTEDTHKNHTCSSRDLNYLYNWGRYFDRPEEQRYFDLPERNDLIYEETDKSKSWIKSSLYVPRMKGWFEHQVMMSRVVTAFKLDAKDHKIGYTPQHKILEKVNHYSTMKIDGKDVTPDAVVMLTIDGKDLLCFIEVDRTSERTHSENDAPKSWTRSVREYRQIIGHKLYKEHFGVDCGALLFIVTTKESKVAGIRREIASEFKENGGKCNYILLTSIAGFGRKKDWRPPKEFTVLDRYWEREGHPPFKLV